MKIASLQQELQQNSYPGRGIVLGRSEDGAYAVSAYFIMGRSENSRNRVFVEDGAGIRTQAFDPSKMVDSEPDHLRTGSRSGRLYHCDQWRPDRHCV